MPAWPSTLPCQPEQGTWQETYQSDVARFQPEAGPPIMRRRGTVQTKLASCTFVFTRSEYATFEQWYRTDIAGGALRFSLDHPVTGSPREWTFEAEPQMSAMTNRKVRVAMQWREIA